MQVKSAAYMSKRSIILGAIAGMGIASIAQSASAAIIITNFGGSLPTGVDALGRKYNSIGSATNGPFALNDITGASTGIQLTVTDPGALTGPAVTNKQTPAQAAAAATGTYSGGFTTFNFNGGTSSPTGQAAAFNYSGAVTGSSGYGDSNYQGNGNGQNVYNPVIYLTLSGLSSADTYGLDIFASRTGVTDNRSADYNISGGVLGTAPTKLTLDAANNTGNVVSATGFTPDANGDITIQVSADAANTQASGFFYTSILEIDPTPVPEPTSIAGLAVGGGLLLRRRHRPLA